jgi:phenylpropionate dioxygenase-like ring-hydroxylating dioxygenase large terminal subunit
MVTSAENDLLTRVEGDAPLGRLMRENYWVPFALSENLMAGDAPTPVRLFGDDFVAFRAADGRIGFLDELCPHRRASLTLARAEGDGLRCIYHGWKIDAGGDVVEAPTQTVRHDQFCANVRTTHFPVHESGGIAWVWLGGTEAPAFPDLPFDARHGVNVAMTYSIVQCNWLQGAEGGLDSAHAAFLHQSWIAKIIEKQTGSVGTDGVRAAIATVPVYETEQTSYGMRSVSLRTRPDGATFARTSHFFLPFVIVVPEGYEGHTHIFAFAPIDDTHHILFFGNYGTVPQMTQHDFGAARADYEADARNFAPTMGDRSARWGQDRELMKAGHFTGFDRTVIDEDAAVQMSMGPVVDRTKENLSGSDVAVATARRIILEALAAFEGGELPPGSAKDPAGVQVPDPFEALLDPGVSWRAVEPA